MKKQPLRSRRAAASPARHQLDHVVPTVIHDPEEKMNTLARWTHRLLRKSRQHLGLVATIAAVLLVLIVGWNLLGGGASGTSDVWTTLESAKKADDRIAVAREHPDSPASSWVLLQAGTELYNQALADMPNNRDVALPMFRRALDLFDQVARAAPQDSPQARAAALAKARALEARNELAKAIEQYELVASTWPQSAEASQAKQLAAELKKPEAQQFYKELYAYAPTKVTLPGFGTERLDSLTAPGASAATKSGSALQSPLLPELPLELTPPLREVRTRTPPKPTPARPELPADVFGAAPAQTPTK
jgi:tetratricopeptide (TPR) repeat protein